MTIEQSQMYPFAHVSLEETTDARMFNEIPSPVEFEPIATQAGRQYFQRPGCNLAASFNQSGPTVEIGGPTRSGYNILHEQALPGPVIITNVNSEHTVGVQPHVVLTSGDRLPFSDASIGLVLTSCLPRVKRYRAQTRQSLDEMLQPYYESAHATLRTLPLTEAREVIKARYGNALRITSMVEAERVLKPGGMYVTRGMCQEDVRFAERLGLAVVGHESLISFSRGKWGKLEFPQEIVFCKTTEPLPETNWPERMRYSPAVLRRLLASVETSW